MQKTQVVVVGASAFGGWTALCLLRRGASVALIDNWGPGNSRASSGGETRVIRGTDRKSTRLNSSHEWSSYAVFCLKQKTRRGLGFRGHQVPRRAKGRSI